MSTVTVESDLDFNMQEPKLTLKDRFNSVKAMQAGASQQMKAGFAKVQGKGKESKRHFTRHNLVKALVGFFLLAGLAFALWLLAMAFGWLFTVAPLLFWTLMVIMVVMVALIVAWFVRAALAVKSL